VLVVAGLLAEMQWGVALAVVQGDVLRPALWRLGLHVGAILMLWAAAVFLIRRDPPMGRVSFGHGLILALAAVAVVVALLFWRVLGAFPPWVSW
jgi:hypothetical protein